MGPEQLNAMWHRARPYHIWHKLLVASAEQQRGPRNNRDKRVDPHRDMVFGTDSAGWRASKNTNWEAEAMVFLPCTLSNWQRRKYHQYPMRILEPICTPHAFAKSNTAGRRNKKGISDIWQNENHDGSSIDATLLTCPLPPSQYPSRKLLHVTTDSSTMALHTSSLPPIHGCPSLLDGGHCWLCTTRTGICREMFRVRGWLDILARRSCGFLISFYTSEVRRRDVVEVEMSLEFPGWEKSGAGHQSKYGEGTTKNMLLGKYKYILISRKGLLEIWTEVVISRRKFPDVVSVSFLQFKPEKLDFPSVYQKILENVASHCFFPCRFILDNRSFRFQEGLTSCFGLLLVLQDTKVTIHKFVKGFVSKRGTSGLGQALFVGLLKNASSKKKVRPTKLPTNVLRYCLQNTKLQNSPTPFGTKTLCYNSQSKSYLNQVVQSANQDHFQNTQCQNNDTIPRKSQPLSLSISKLIIIRKPSIRLISVQ